MTGRKRSGERDLSVLLASLDPELHPGRYVFALSPNGEVPRDVELIAWVREDEGLTLVLSQEDATRAGLQYESPMQWITLRVHSSLDAVGMTAAFSTALAVAGISANVIAGLHHDHIFVGAGDGERAVEVLRALSAATRGR